MKISEISSENLSRIASENNLKSSLLKAVLGSVDVDESGKVGDVDLRDHIAKEIGPDTLAAMTDDSSLAFPAQGGGKANPIEPIADAENRRYAHVLTAHEHGARAQSGSTPGATVDNIQDNRYAHVLKEQK